MFNRLPGKRRSTLNLVSDDLAVADSLAARLGVVRSEVIRRAIRCGLAELQRQMPQFDSQAATRPSAFHQVD